ncbi:MAG: hypothetical protein Kow0073_11890 [Immundisolibacter sp.]
MVAAPLGATLLGDMGAATWVPMSSRPSRPAREKLGLDYSALTNVRPDIILVTVSTNGDSGPYAGRPGIDP